MKRVILCLVVCVFILGISTSHKSGQTASASAVTSFRFVAWGDSRSSSSSGVNTSVLSSLSDQANGLSPALTIFDGDLCSTWDSTCTSTGSSGWKYAINAGSPGNGMFNKTLAWRGNHDNSASGWDSYFNMQGTVTAIGATNFAYYSSDGSDRTYSFDYGNSHFVGIDMPGGDISTMTSGQINWLDSDIAAAETRGVTHTFLLDHGPIYYVDDHSSSPPASLITAMNKHNSISASFHGHEHVLAYVHIDASRISGVIHPWEEFVSGNSGAPEYPCASGRSDFCTQTQGFAAVDVNGNSFTVSIYYIGSESNPAKTWTFTKNTSAGVTLSPSSLAFANQAVGTTSSAQSLTLKNGTAAGVSVSGISIGGTNSGDFAETNTCGSSLAAGATCRISVSFTPAATGSRTAALSVSNSGSGSSLTASLTGTGVNTTASVSPATLTFASQVLGTTSATQFSTLTNSGSSTLTINSMAISGDFAFAGTGTCGSSLAPGSSCRISVNFTPTATGTRTGQITITDTATNSPQTVSLTGTGTSSSTGPVVSLSPISLAFASQAVGTTSTAKYVTVSNTGNAALTFSGPFQISGDFAFAGLGTCGASLSAGASCTISVNFRPTATGTRTGLVTMTDNAPNSPQTIPLTGTGGSGSTSGPAVSLSPALLTFGNQAVGTTSSVQYVTLTNTGTATLTFSGSFTITGDFAFAGLGTCGSSVAPSAKCTISVKFTPMATGTRTGLVTIADNAPNSPQRVPLTGTGGSSSTSGPVVSLSPASLTFGSQAVGTTSSVQYVTLTNTGTATLTFSGSFTITGDFAFAGLGTCGSLVASGASCTISVKFTPKAKGTRTGMVTLNDNAPNAPQSIPLSGTGS